MSPKTSGLLRLYATIIVLALPGLPVVFTTAGYTKVAAALTLVGAIVAVVWHAYQEAIPKLPDGDGKTGGSATIMGGSAITKTDLPKVPPAAPLAVLALVVMTGCSWFRANGPTVVTDVAQITACVIAAVDASDGGIMNLSNIASTCGAATIDAVIQILDQTLAKEQAVPTPNVVRIAKLKALGADASRVKPVGDGGAQ